MFGTETFHWSENTEGQGNFPAESFSPNSPDKDVTTCNSKTFPIPQIRGVENVTCTFVFM